MAIPKRSFLVLAVLWLLVISFLFSLPGSALPKTDWLDKIHFDKWVHFGFFFLLTWLWCKGLGIKKQKAFYGLLLLIGLYGFFVEVAQDRLVANRSFDWGDLIADIIGSFAGIWFCMRYIKK